MKGKDHSITYSTFLTLLDSQLWPKDAVKADPVLSDLGFQQSREAGVFLNTLLASDGITSADQITLVTSPFIRCVQSANEVIDSLINVNGTIDIFLEIGMANAIRSNFDYDAAVERLSTQQRVNTTIQNRLGVPKESNEYHNRHEFKARVTEVVNSLNQAFPYEPGTAILAVTHGSVAPLLVKDAGHYRLKEDHFKRVRPGCISKLSRMSNKQVWDVELLLYDEHISEMGVTQR